MYDEILFNGATFGDLDRGDGPLIVATATDISTGSRFTFVQSEFDLICSELDAVPLSRAAAANPALVAEARKALDGGARAAAPAGESALPSRVR